MSPAESKITLELSREIETTILAHHPLLLIPNTSVIFDNNGQQLDPQQAGLFDQLKPRPSCELKEYEITGHEVMSEQAVLGHVVKATFSRWISLPVGKSVLKVFSSWLFNLERKQPTQPQAADSGIWNCGSQEQNHNLGRKTWLHDNESIRMAVHIVCRGW